jgi:leucyl aminopeptidase
MEFSIKAGSPEKLKSACIVVGVYADKKLAPSATLADAAAQGALGAIVRRGDMTGKRGTALMLHGVTGVLSERVLLVGLGKAAELNDKTYAEVLRAAFKAIATSAATDAIVTLAEIPVGERSLADKIRAAVTIARETAYRYDQTKSRKEDPATLRKLTFTVDKADQRAAGRGLAEGVALANGTDLAKTLGNLPANICTPTYLAQTARTIGREWGLKIEVLERRQMEALKMGSLLSVARGSVEPPKLIVLRYSGAGAKSAPVVLVGKGVTFDTGGISLKPGEGMDEMKFDMCGAASVLGTLRAVAEMQLAINVIGIIPATENMPSGIATKPGDIVTSMSGQTIEILNTDAEGRLILCDALTYAERFKPAAVIDIATLTGACVIALGSVNSGLFSPNDALADEICQAGRNAGDPAWRMPLDDDYQDALKSNFADMANVGGRPAGSITAACFLARYTKNYKWAHLDIAGTAWKSGALKGSTGRPVPLLTEFLKARAG